MATPYQVAQQYKGQVEGYKNNLLNRFLNGDTAGMTSAEFAWCSRFVKQAAIQAGVPAEKLAGVDDMARSWLKAGTETTTPKPGDVVVTTRGDPNGPYGHVGFYEGPGSKPGTIKLLAGNQGNAVSSADVSTSSVLGYRRLDGTMPQGGEMLPNALAGIAGGPMASLVGTAATAAGAGGNAATSMAKLPSTPTALAMGGGDVDGFVNSLFGGGEGGGIKTPFGSLRLGAPEQAPMAQAEAPQAPDMQQAPLDLSRLKEVIASRPTLGLSRSRIA